MTITIHRPVYTGTGYRAMNGSGLALTLEQEVESLEQAIYDLLTEVRAVLGGPNSTLAAELLTVREAVKVPPAAQQYYSNIWDVLKPLFDFFAPLVPYEQAWSQAMQLFAQNNTPQQVDTTTTNITTIINTGVPSTALPSPPPAGYGGASENDIADAIWGYLLGTTNAKGQNHNMLAGNILGFLGTLANIYGGSDGQGDIRTPWFRWVSDDSEYTCSPNWLARIPPFDVVPVLDFSLVQAGDTVLSYLTREYGDWDWTTTNPAGEANSGRVWALVLDSTPAVWLRCNLTDQELHHLTTTTTTAAGGAPVWPGEAGVTFGTGVPLAAGVFIEEAMDGIQLNILSSDRQIPYVGAGTFKLYRSMGRVAFMTDDGYLEAWQPVPANQCVMVPKSMAQASGVVLSFYTGVAGLVTPWTRNV